MFSLKEEITNLDNDWVPILISLCEPYYNKIDEFLNAQINDFNGVADIFPPTHSILSAFKLTPFHKITTIILGQDAYPTKGNAMGLCFSVPNDKKCPPSLRAIFKELERSYNIKRTNTDLSDWANQGVLLLNTALTVREGSPGSHIKIWKDFTKDIIKYIASNKQGLCYMLWGEHAISYNEFIDKDSNKILTHSHPSPLSRKPFVGCNHFVLCNEYLTYKNDNIITWV